MDAEPDERDDDDADGDAGDATEADAIGTEAASPRALAVVHPEPERKSTATRTPLPTATDALGKSDLASSFGFHIFGISAPLVAIAITYFIGGDPLALHLFWLGSAVLAVCNVALAYVTSKPERRRTRTAGVLWVVATAAIVTGVYYFGPYSAVVMVDVLGIAFVALGSNRATALAVTLVATVGQLALAFGIGFHVIADRGVLQTNLGHTQLVLAEALIIVLFLASFSLGRWARGAHARSLTELAEAMRVIGDQQQAIAEVADAEARAKRANEGRWSGQTLGGFKLGLVLGRGAMGEVYEAAGARGEVAAVKLLNARAMVSADIVERFQREMAIAARLDSPHIVRVFAISPPDAPVPYIAMERLVGTDLATRLRGETRLPTDEVVALVEQIARGLDVARLAGIVHRDLKPHNVFHHEQRTWKILDFGVSKVLDSEGTLTGEGIVGTPGYMAPEQASGGQVTHLSDVYALGAIAYRCLTGRTPFRGKDLAQLAYQVVHVPPARPSALGRVSRTVEDVLAIAMAKDPRRRFPSAMSFAQALVAARRGKPAAVQAPENAWS